MDDWGEVDLVASALLSLMQADNAWKSNYYAFQRMESDQRHRWWQLAKKQADKGLPSMQKLLLEVIKLRIQS